MSKLHAAPRIYLKEDGFTSHMMSEIVGDLAMNVGIQYGRVRGVQDKETARRTWAASYHETLRLAEEYGDLRLVLSDHDPTKKQRIDLKKDNRDNQIGFSMQTFDKNLEKRVMAVFESYLDPYPLPVIRAHPKGILRSTRFNRFGIPRLLYDLHGHKERLVRYVKTDYKEKESDGDLVQKVLDVKVPKDVTPDDKRKIAEVLKRAEESGRLILSTPHDGRVLLERVPGSIAYLMRIEDGKTLRYVAEVMRAHRFKL